MSNAPIALVVLISGSGSNLQAIIDAINAGSLNARIQAVISNRADAYGLQRAQQAGIATEVLAAGDYPEREDYDRALQQLIDSYTPQLVILAGFMRILSDVFVDHYAGRMLNIHPSLLPKYRGLNTHQRVLDAGDPQHGASVHFVTSELDSGALVIQAAIDVEADDTADSLARRVHQVEHIIYPMAIDWFANGRLDYIDAQAYLDGKQLSHTPCWIGDRLVFHDE